MIGKIFTGPQIAGDNVLIAPRAGKMGDTICSDLHGKYYEQVYRGNVFGAANQAAVTTTAGLATTFTGFAVANPATSGVNLVLLRYSVAQVAAAVASAIGLMSGAGAAAGALTVVNRKIGVSTPASATTASAGATIATPVLIETYGQAGSVATTSYGTGPGLVVDLAGSIIVPPGNFVASYTTAACTSAFVFALTWEEVPV